MSVRDKLLMGSFTRSDKAGIADTLNSILTRFPRLKERYGQQSGTLSGGEQQMMVIGRPLMAKATLLLLDEPSLGIAPKLVQDIARAIVSISRDEGVSVLLVEQNSRMALSISNRAYGLSTGTVVLSGRSRGLMGDDRIKAAYLGGCVNASSGREAQPHRVDDHQDRCCRTAQGPASIDGYYDEAISLAGLLALIEATPGADAIVIACFDDTGLDAARCLTDRPVIGIGEAACHFASMLANAFSVVTTLARSVPALEHNLHRYGLWARCARVRSSDVAVLDLERSGSDAQARISAEIGRAVAEDRAEAVVLGCAGMTDLAGALSAEHGVPVLDGVSCAVALAESMVRLGLRTSRRGGYAPPPAQKRPARD